MTCVKFLVLFSAMCLIACEQDVSDAPSDSEQAETAEDTASDLDAPRFEADSVEAFYYPGNDPAWVLLAKSSETWLYIENYPGFGGASESETRKIKGVDTNYGTCGVCVLLKTGCQPHGDHAHCQRTFMVEAGGSVTFEDLGRGAGKSWSGSLSPMRFLEVSMDGDTFETTPIEDGEIVEIGGWDFDVVLEEG